MIRFAVTFATLAIAASATCSPRPDALPYDEPRFDAGEDDGGSGLDAGVALDCRPCTTWGPVEITGPLPSVLDELSGLAASRATPGVLYAHNDSGDSPRFFALDYYGRELAELRLAEAEAIDWEDMALGPCEQATCLFLADIGDNLRKRTDYVVYRVREPELSGLLSASPGEHELDLPFDRLPFRYPDDARHNAETLLVHPQTGDLYVVTKERTGTPSELYRFPRPFTPGEKVTLIAMGKLQVPTPDDTLVTGGDLHPCGDALLLRMYNRIVELRALPDAGVESVFHAAAQDRPAPTDEPQGEAITWGPDGQSYFTASEHTGQSLHRVRCQRAE